MIVMQASAMHSESQSGLIGWHLKMIKPVLFCAPFCLLMAGTGYAVAIRCASRAIVKALLVGCAVGAGWALIAVIAGNIIARLNGATPLAIDRAIRMLTVTPAIFVPLAMAPCLFTRRRAVRFGFVSSAK